MRLSKLGWLSLLGVLLISQPRTVNAVTCFQAPCTVTLHIRARVINAKDWGMSQEVWNEIGKVNSPGWQTRQCCMVQRYNETHERQVNHDYCADEQIREWMERGACKTLLGQ